MKTKQSIRKNKLVKTTMLATTLVVVFTMVFGSAAAIQFAPEREELTIQPVAGTIMPQNPETFTDKTPYQSAPNPQYGEDAIWNIQLKFDEQVANGGSSQGAGIGYDGTYIYCPEFSTLNIHKFTKAGVKVETFTLSGMSAYPRDLCYDGTYFYGGAGSTTIYKMDFVAKTLVGTITSPVAVRAIAYDPIADAFWCADYGTSIVLVSRAGAALQTIPNPALVPYKYGMAYDGITSGGPYLWIHNQEAGTGDYIYQMNIATGLLTGVVHNVLPDVPECTAMVAGGLEGAVDFVSGKYSLIAFGQGTPDDWVIVYEISDAIPLAHDISVLSIDAPVTGEGSASITPKATVKNMGTNAENFNLSLKIFQEGVGTTQLWQESFENWVLMNNGTFPPTNWGVTNNNGYGTWLRNSSVANARSGWNSSYIRNDTTQNDDILWTKATSIAANGTSFSFYYKVWLNGAPETFKVGWWNGTGPNWHWLTPVTSTNGNTWTKYTYNLPDNFTGTSVYFAVNYISNDWYGLRVDDFTFPDGSTEGFEGTLGYFTSPSTNWISVATAGTSTNNYWKYANNATVVRPDHNTMHGTKMAFYQIYPKLALGNVASLRMTTPLDLSSYGQELMTFQFYLYQTSTSSSYQDKVALDISIDNGATWKQLGEWRQYDALNPLWNKKAVSLLGYEDATSALFQFRASAGSASGYDIAIDNVTIVAVPYTTLVTELKAVSLAAGATTQVSFTPWALPGWQSPLLPYNNTNVKYNVKVKAILATDEKLSNNIQRASPLIHYPYLHDVGITAINQPVTGPGAASVPVSYTIKNFGQYPENGALSWFFSNISIYDYPSATTINKDFSDSVASPEYYGPNNWVEQHIAGTSTANFDVQSTGSSPTCTPKVGYRMLRYNSYSISSGGIDRIYTAPLNLSGVGPVRLKFWMMHDTGYLTNAESVTWQWSPDGTTWNDLPGGTFLRSTQLQGLPAVNAWYEWKVDLTPIENMSSVRIGMLCKSFYGNNMFFDDVRVYQMGTLINKFREGFEIYDPAGYTFGPGFTQVRLDNWQTWKVAGTTPATFTATCTEVGSQWAQNEQLITPAFSCAGVTTPWLSFTRQLYLSGTPDSVLTVLGSDNGGVNWNYTILTLNTLTASGTYEALQSWMVGQTNIKLAFKFTSTNDTSKLDYAIIDNIKVTDKTSVQEYMVPYVPPVVLNPGDSVTVTPVNWNPAPQPSGPHNYKASANTFLTTDANALNNNLITFFTLTYGHDLSVQAITQPSAGWFAAGTYPVAGTIKNLGTYTESKTATATIYDASSTVVYTGTFAVTSLASGAEVTATFASWVISTSGEYKLKIEVPADDNNANNFKELPGIKIDATAPVSTHTLSPAAPNGLNGWYISDVSITLSATDAGSGVASIKYQVDGGSWQTYSGAISISTDGTHTVKYYAIDNVANTEGEHTIPAIKIDKTKPTITLTATSQNTQNNKWLLEATVSDATSGVAKVEFYIAGALIGTVTTAPYEYLYEGTDGPAKAIVYDNAGNSLTSPDVSSHESSQSQSQPHSTILSREIKQL